MTRIETCLLVGCFSFICSAPAAAQDWALSPKALEWLGVIRTSADSLAQAAPEHARTMAEKQSVIDHATEGEYLDLLEKFYWPGAKVMNEALDRIPDSALKKLSASGFARLMFMIAYKDWDPEFYNSSDGAGHCKRARAMIKLWDRLPDSYLKRLSIPEITLVMRSLPGIFTSEPDAMNRFAERTLSEDKLGKMNPAEAAELFRAYGTPGIYAAPPPSFWKGLAPIQLAGLLDSFKDRPDMQQKIMAAWTEANRH